ncbi:MAG TPA: TSUP family transporter [Castellaniella sp.]|uniref:TSUP family transporter n=1 Tax=Castellaniella sp. TaxID=1955812 RepID=UPI002F0E50A9
MEISLDVAFLLFFVAMAAGTIDAIAGGGGLITIPALLAVGLPPGAAIATNKVGGFGSSAAASLQFLRKRQIDLKKSRWMILSTFAGALIGAFALTRIDSSILQRVIPILLIGFALYFLLSPRVGAKDSTQRLSHTVYAATLAPLIGFYDAFFGPGTGTFLAISAVTLLGMNLTRATGHAKLLNLSSNVVALLFYGLHGNILWAFGLPMLAGQWIGGTLGARLAVNRGQKLIRVVMVIMATIVSVKMMWQG